MKTNYQLLMDKTIEELHGSAPSLLLHACCAPCASYVTEYLAKYFHVTLFFYNPNIYPPSEYEKRLGEMEKLLASAKYPNPVELLPGEYAPADFLSAASGLESCPEGGARCGKCFYLRLEETARTAKERGFQYFCTTLTVSPHKNAELINAIGTELSEKYSVPYLASDFKKREGYKRSTELSRLYGLYRQNYCGCEFSLANQS